MSTFLDLSSRFNAMHPAFAKKLGLIVQSLNIGAQKINDTTFKTYEMVIAAFSVIDQSDRVKFFEETFFIANVNPDVIYDIIFLTLSNADINFLKKKL